MALLSARGVTHRFGGLAAVSSFAIDVDQDELVGIIGPNGAGKTTVFNLVTGIYRPTEGEMSFGGRSIVGLRPNQIAGLGIARTFQNIRLFKDLSVLDNVRVAHYADAKYGPFEAMWRLGRLDREEERISERSLELLTLFKLESLALSPARSLPYGFQRRLEMARALALRPKLLLLDEPAAGMNRAETLELMDFIRWVKREFSLTILLIEHQMDLVMGICERLVVLDFGITIATGRPEEIRRNPKVLESYLGQEVHGAHG
ncbi:MAG: ABC transporter ATP-binding protein [Thermoanaerobaculia bacterium]